MNLGLEGFPPNPWRRIVIGMATEGERSRSLARLERLSGSTEGSEAIAREVIAELQRVIGFDRWCVTLADPDSLIPVVGFADHDYGPALPRALELEYSTDTIATKPALAKGGLRATSLAAQTNADLARSTRWDEVMRPVGIGDVALVACCDALGCWGWIEVYRDLGDRTFSEDDIALLRQLGLLLGPTLRRKGAYGQPATPLSAAPGVLVLDAALQPVGWTPGTDAWLAVIPPSQLFLHFGILPALVYPLAVRARLTASSASARVIGEDGRWIVVEAAPYLGSKPGAVAITMRTPTAGETFGLLSDVHGLTPRERQVVELLTRGLDTRSVAEALFIAPHTVQDHLKAIFAKTATNSRREVISRFAFGGSGGASAYSA